MPVCVDSRNDDVSIGNLAWLDVEHGHAFLPGVPLLVLKLDLIIDKSDSWADRRTLDVGILSDLVREISPCL